MGWQGDMIIRRAHNAQTRTRSLYLLACNAAATLKPVFRFKRHAKINDQKASLGDVADRTYDLIMRIFGTKPARTHPCASKVF